MYYCLVFIEVTTLSKVVLLHRAASDPNNLSLPYYCKLNQVVKIEKQQN